MSYYKKSANQYTGAHEFNRVMKFLGESGWRQNMLLNAGSFGFIPDSIKENNFLVQQGTNAGTIKINDGYAIDKIGNLIYHAFRDNIAIANDSVWKWIKIKHQYSPNELGTVSIDDSGNLTGNGTEFTSLLRGPGGNASRIRFTDSSSNTQEYDVLEVISDTSAVLMGDFTAESDIKFAVVGTFTPDFVPSSGQKDVFQYDSCLVTLVNEVSLNTPPAILADEEFIVARVRNSGGTITIQDKRSQYFKNVNAVDLSMSTTSSSPLFGVEGVRWDVSGSTRTENIISVVWGFSSFNFTIDSNLNKITLLSGSGGKFKDTSYFTDGDFDGWRIYAPSGKYSIIKQSSKTSNQINLILDNLDVDVFLPSGVSTQGVFVVPNVEEIEISVTPSSNSKLAKVHSMPVFPVSSNIRCTLTEASTTTSLSYRYKSYKTYSPSFNLGDDLDGYYNEASYEDNGSLKSNPIDRTLVPYSGSNITLTRAGDAYSTTIDSITTGDKFGIRVRELNNASPVVTLEVGVDEQHQYIHTLPVERGGLGEPYNIGLSASDHYINLKKTGATLREGNTFYVRFYGIYTIGARTIRFVQDYINSGSTGTPLFNFTSFDFNKSQTNNLFFECTYYPSGWTVRPIVSLPQSIEDSINAIMGRTNQSVLFRTNDGSTDYVASTGAAGKTYTAYTFSSSHFGGTSYGYTLVIIAQAGFRSDSDGGEQADWVLEISTNGGSSWIQLRTDTYMTNGDAYVPVIQISNYNLPPSSNFQVRQRAIVTSGIGARFSNENSFNVFAINTYQP